MSDRSGGISIGVEVIIGDLGFGDDSVLKFTYSNTIDAIPEGHAEIVVTDPDKFTVDSGSYGMFRFINSGNAVLDKSSFTFYITDMQEEFLSNNSVRVIFDWKLGTPDSMKQETYAIRMSTAIAALEEIFKNNEFAVTNYVQTAAGMDTSADTMTWRCVNSNMEDFAQDVVEHSNLAGDYLFWAFDEVTGGFVISSFKYAMTMAPANVSQWNANAYSSTGMNSYTHEPTNQTMWLHVGEKRVNTRGKQRGSAFPNLVFSNVVSGEADVSACRSDCFGKIVSSLGGKTSAEIKTEYGISDTKGSYSYGDMAVVEPFPCNTHKEYHLAQAVRKRLLSEYSKAIQITIQNEVGPSVGSRLSVYTYSPDHQMGNNIPDAAYTDTYIVLSKTIEKDMGTSRGILGVPDGELSPVYRTTLLLVSNLHDGSGFEGAVATTADLSKKINDTIGVKHA